MMQVLTITAVDNGRVEISTSRLLLRAAQENDVDSLYGAFSNAEVMKYWYVGLVTFFLNLAFF